MKKINQLCVHFRMIGHNVFAILQIKISTRHATHLTNCIVYELHKHVSNKVENSTETIIYFNAMTDL